MDPTQDNVASPAILQLSSDDIQNALILRVQAYAASELEKEYMWMAKTAVQRISKDAASLIDQGIISQKPVMDASKSRINFFELSPEIRNQIYELVLKGHSDDRMGRVVIQKQTLRGREKQKAGSFSKVPPLLQTSKKIRSETQSLYYASTCFVLELGSNYSTSTGQRWLTQIGPKLQSKITDRVIRFQLDTESTVRRRIERMARSRKQNEALRLHNGQLWASESDHVPLEISMPRQLRTRVTWIKDMLGFETHGIDDTALTITYRAHKGKEKPSSTELYCPFCYHCGEPDTAKFAGGVCVDCTASRVENDMQVGPWCRAPGTSDRG